MVNGIVLGGQMVAIVDCPRCAAPKPLGSCPHCSSGFGHSLRAIALELALLGAAACNGSSPIQAMNGTTTGTTTFADAYGLPFTFDAGTPDGG